MKICMYCESMNDDSAKVCTGCGANAFKNKCNNCGTVFRSAFCPTCGIKAGTQAKVCPQCGEKYFTPACPKCGHNSALNKTRQQAVQEPKRIIIEHVTHTEEKPKKKFPFGKVLLWIIFLPIMAFIAVWKSKRIPARWKLLITAAIPLLCILNYPVNESSEKMVTIFQSIVSQFTDNAAKTAAPGTAPQKNVKKTAVHAEETPIPVEEATTSVEEMLALVEETTAPAKQNRNGFREGTKKHTIATYSVSVPNCFGDPIQSSANEDLLFVDADEGINLIMSFSQNDVSEKDFVERIERGILNLLQNGELTDSEEIKMAGLPGRMLKATGYYSNTRVSVTAAVALDEKQQGTFSIILMQGDNAQYDYYADFQYIVRSVTVSQKAVTKQSATSEPKNDKTVSKKLKEVLDGYEAFVDSYCTFMKKYNDSDDVTGMAIEYLNILAKYYEWTNKLDDIDEDALSAADLLYYNEVMLRCTNKLLQVSND